MPNQVVWFDIPVVDLDRAIRFYSAVLGAKLAKEDFQGFSMGMLPMEEGSVSGCLVQTKENSPSAQGVLIYLNVQGRLDDAIRAVEGNGGKVVQGRHSIEPYGFRAIVLDSEGNRVALHSM